MAEAEPLMVWAACFQALIAVASRSALEIKRHLVREQLQHLVLERRIAHGEAREIGAIDGISLPACRPEPADACARS